MLSGSCDFFCSLNMLLMLCMLMMLVLQGVAGAPVVAEGLMSLTEAMLFHMTPHSLRLLPLRESSRSQNVSALHDGTAEIFV